MLIQTLNQNAVAIEATDLAVSNKKSGIHVLHVDDDPSVLEITKLMLQDLDGSFEIDQACCVDEALKKLSTGNYDIVVSDYEMPKKNGLEFLKELREKNNNTPFILFTGKGREEVAIQALNLGADRYLNKQGSPETVYGELAHGIRSTIERIKAKSALEESEKRYRTLIEQAAEAIFVHDTNGQIIDVNQQACRSLGYTKKELLLLNIADIDAEATENKKGGLFWSKVLAGQSFTFESTQKRKDGSTLPVEVNLGPITLCKETMVIGLVREITERKQIAIALQKSEEKFRSLFMNMLNGVAYHKMVFDSCGKPIDYIFLEVNNTFLKQVGFKKEDLLGKKATEAFPGIEKDPANWINIYGRVATSGEPVTFENYSQALKKYFVVSAFCPEKGYFAVTFEDITERKEAEESLKESEEKFRAISDSAMDAVLLVDRTGKLTYWNVTAEKIFGYTKEEALGKQLEALLIPPQHRSFYFGFLEKLSNSASVSEGFGGVVELTSLRKGGPEFPIELSVSGLKFQGELCFVGIARDISERKKMADALRQERDLLESLTVNIGAGLVMVSKDYRILWMNSYLKELTGASENNHCYSSFNTCTTTCPDCGPKKIFEGASIDRREYCNQTEFNKDHPVWFELIATPIKDADGNVVAALELTVNITEKKIAEQKLKENSEKIELMNEKLRVVGGLTMHDVRNKLSAVTGYAYLLKNKNSDQADIVEGLVKIEQSVKEMVRIFDFAKLYEQLGAEELTTIDVEAKINEAKTLFSGSLPKIINECHGLTVLADSFLRQMFYNFIDNTRKYGQKTTTIRMHYQKTDADSLKLIYEDDGVGISAENKLKLFAEGFSTGGSTGFGLFLTKKMIEVYGWKIEENGAPNEGAKFTITIPKLNKNGKENYQIVP